jgi:biopolymer transport protein ExbD
MKIPREAKADEFMTPVSLLDVIFILLLFYITATTFKEEERDEQVNLPNTAESTSLSSSSQKLIVINVRGLHRAPDSPLFLVSNRGMSIDQLRKTVKDAVVANPHQKILIRGDEKALHGDVANAITACRQAGVATVNIGYDFRPVRP